MNSSLSGGRILVVDDTEANRYTVARILRKEGFEVREAADGVQALARVNDDLDLVILDIRMPEMDGYEVCKRLKADPVLQAIPVLHISATYTGTKDIAYGLESGADGYLTHPVDPGVLVATVRAFLRIRQADRALRESEAQARSRAEELQAVMQAVPAAVMMAHDRECRVITGNAAAHELLRLPQDANLSKTPAATASPTHFTIVRDGRELPVPELPIRRATLSGAPIAGEELEIRFQDGSSRYVYGSATPLFDESGNVRGAVGAYLDMTDLHHARGQLERAQRIETIGRLAGGVAHETNNQMTVVLGFAQYLLGGTNLTQAQLRDLQQVKRSAERVAQLTRQLLALSRRQTLHLETLDLNALVRESHPLLQRLVGPENVLMLDLDHTPKWVRADRTQLIQVLLNLVMNSRDAMPQGGRITIGTRRTDKLPADGRFGRSWDSDEAVILWVSDTGTGIDPALNSRVFEPFFTTKPTGQGTGLGLSVVEGIIEQSRGEMWLNSQLGQGTTFTIALPLVQASPEDDLQEEQSSSGGRETILLVDDEDAVREVFARGLKEKGYQVLEASEGSQALEILQQATDEIDLVVTDVAMPGMTGVELARRALDGREFLPFIFVSGQPREVLPDFGSLAPDHPLLEKPFTPEALASCVRSTLDARPAASHSNTIRSRHTRGLTSQR
ncbi:MAG TPA: response regulator [Gemmatimonadales bacterium]|nr:response regulator [Gemmatimonadales bacterium]